MAQTKSTNNKAGPTPARSCSQWASRSSWPGPRRELERHTSRSSHVPPPIRAGRRRAITVLAGPSRGIRGSGKRSRSDQVARQTRPNGGREVPAPAVPRACGDPRPRWAPGSAAVCAGWARDPGRRPSAGRSGPHRGAAGPPIELGPIGSNFRGRRFVIATLLSDPQGPSGDLSAGRHSSGTTASLAVAELHDNVQGPLQHRRLFSDAAKRTRIFVQGKEEFPADDVGGDKGRTESGPRRLSAALSRGSQVRPRSPGPIARAGAGPAGARPLPFRFATGRASSSPVLQASGPGRTAQVRGPGRGSTSFNRLGDGDACVGATRSLLYPLRPDLMSVSPVEPQTSAGRRGRGSGGLPCSGALRRLRTRVPASLSRRVKTCSQCSSTAIGGPFDSLHRDASTRPPSTE